MTDKPHGPGAAPGRITRRQWLAAGVACGTACGVAEAVWAADIDTAAMGRLAPWGGKPTPALAARTLQGQPRSLQDFAGQPLVLNFWASYCAPCQLEMPMFNQLQERFKAQGLRVVGVNHGEMPARVQDFLAKVPFEGVVLLDRSQTQLKAWGGYALPTSFLIDRAGRIQSWHMGELDWMQPEAIAQVRALL